MQEEGEGREGSMAQAHSVSTGRPIPAGMIAEKSSLGGLLPLSRLSSMGRGGHSNVLILPFRPSASSVSEKAVPKPPLMLNGSHLAS